MTKAQVKAAIRRDIRGWRGVLGLDGWDISVEWPRMDDGTVALNSSIWGSRDTVLSFDCDQLAKYDRDFIRRAVLHELVHVVCCGYVIYRRTEQLEAMVSDLTTALDRCWKAPAPK